RGDDLAARVAHGRRDRVQADLELLERAREPGLTYLRELRLQLGPVNDRPGGPALEGLLQQPRPYVVAGKREDDLAASGAVDRCARAEPVDAHHRRRSRRLLDRHD